MSENESEEKADKLGEHDDTEPGRQSVLEAPADVRDEALFQLTMDVVKEMDALAAAYLSRDGYKWIPHRDTRPVTPYKESGWPNVGLKRKDESSVHHGALFATRADSIHPYQYDQIPAMIKLDDYVRSSDELLARLQDPAGEQRGDGEIAGFFLQYAIHALPSSIYDRAMAQGLTINDPAVVDLYLQRERSWLAPELPYQYVVPLVVTDLEIDHARALDIDDRTRVVRLTEDEIRRMAQSYETAGVPGPLADAAWWALVIDMPPLTNPGEGRRMFIREPVDTSVIDAACDALRVVAAVKTGWARVFRQPLGWADHWEGALPNLTHLYTARRYPAEFDDRAWLRRSEPISAKEAAQVPAAAAALKTATEPTKLAMRRLSMALVRDAPDDQLIDACIGLEALLGQVDAELSYRIALRAAALLSTKTPEPMNPQSVFQMARKIYSRRSELVHGSTKAKNAVFKSEDGAEFSMNFLATFLLREVLHERLLRPAWTVEELDAAVLTALRPAGNAEPPDAG